MAALAVAVRPFAGGVPRRAATVPFDASERVSGKKRPRHGVAPARDSAACLTKIISSRNSVVTANGEMSSHELLQKRLVSELGALRGLLKKAELISQRGACNGGAPTAGKKERFLASKQPAKPIESDGVNAPSVKKRKISTPVEQKQKQIPAPPRMSPEERKQLKGRLSSLSGKLPGHIVYLKTRLDKFSEESKDDKVATESKDDKVAEESNDDKVAEEYADISIGLSCIIDIGGSKLSSSSSGGSDTRMVQQSFEAKKVQDAQQRAAPKAAVDMRALLYRANLRRQLLEMERAAPPDQSIDPRELHRLAVLALRSVAIRASCASSGSSSRSTRS